VIYPSIAFDFRSLEIDLFKRGRKCRSAGVINFGSLLGFDYAVRMLHALFGDTSVGWSKTIMIGGTPVVCELLGSDEVTLEHLDALVPFVERAADFDKKARAGIAADVDEYGTSLYLDHHLAEFSDDQVLRIFGAAHRSEVTRECGLARLELVRIGLDFFGDAGAVFDYSFSPADTQYVLAVSFDTSGEISSIEMES
jgi:hypothetical protein